MSKYNRSQKKIFYIAAAIILIIFLEVSVLFSLRNTSGEPKSSFLKTPISHERARWSKYIDEFGAEIAYEKFKKKYESSNFGIQHSAAHILGELFFEKKGVDGFTFCDSTFSFGCYHGFFGEAVENSGLKIISDLDLACVKKYGLKGLGCPHGIGHGVLSYLGDANLLEALQVCSELSWKEPIGGCTSGVFMEYNFRTMLDPNGESMRPLDNKDVHAPCSSLPEKFLQACYFEQANWWEKVFNYDYAKVGKLCDDIKNTPVREACFRGLGQSIGPSSKYDSSEAKKRCSQMPDDESRLLCRQGAAWSFFADPAHKDRATELCDDLPGSGKYICIDGIDITKRGQDKTL